jgi:hypothetical protein
MVKEVNCDTIAEMTNGMVGAQLANTLDVGILQSLEYCKTVKLMLLIQFIKFLQ